MIQPQAPILSVSELNRHVRLTIEQGISQVWVAGEVSNLTRAPSGHWYFTLKDSLAAVRCAMFRNRNQLLDWRPENGMQVEARVQPTLYEPRGEFQLTVEAMRRAGLGMLYEAYARLKDKLEREGLFDPSRKRPLPPYPRRLGIVTSPRAVALRDVLTTLRRRWPHAEVIVYPTPVQGAGAAERIAAALRTAGARRECELLLVVRGGGSIEDLWSYNEEAVARAIAESPIPVVCGIGHETDFTIADFVADLRAPTPTGAAQLATPDGSELRRRLVVLRQRLALDMRRRLDAKAQRLDGLAQRLRHPAQRLEGQRRHLAHLVRRLSLSQKARLHRQAQTLQLLTNRLRARLLQPARERTRLDGLLHRLRQASAGGMHRRRDRVAALREHLTHLNPDAVLARGYSIVRRADGGIVRAREELAVGEAVDITLARGGAGATITRLRD